MATRLENLMRMRSGLDNPYPSSPSFHSLFRQEISEEQDIVNATNNSTIAWATNEYQLNYSSGQTEYAINVSDWGRVLYVVKETSHPWIPYISVPFSDVSEQRYGTVMQWYNNSYNQALVLTETPEKMSFYRSGVLDASYMVSIQPAPQESATYIITYLPGYIGDADPLESAIQMPEHAELVRLRAMTAQLPYAKWYEDEDKNDAKRRTLAQAFAFQLERKEKLFADYIRRINTPRMSFCDPWNA